MMKLLWKLESRINKLIPTSKKQATQNTVIIMLAVLNLSDTVMPSVAVIHKH